MILCKPDSCMVCPQHVVACDISDDFLGQMISGIIGICMVSLEYVLSCDLSNDILGKTISGITGNCEVFLLYELPCVLLDHFFLNGVEVSASRNMITHDTTVNLR